MNETNNNTATNETATNETTEDGNLTAILDTVEESGILDTLMDEPLLMALVAVVLGMGAYIAYTIPAVKELVFKYLKNNEAELMDMLECPLCGKRGIGYLYDGTKRCYHCNPLNKG